MLGILEAAQGKGYLVIFLVLALEVAIPIFYWIALSPKPKEEED